MLNGSFTFNKRDLLEQSNVYIKWGEIVKLRDMNFEEGWYKHLDQKRINREIITQGDLDYLKTFSKVIIEGEHGISFYNFNGSLAFN